MAIVAANTTLSTVAASILAADPINDRNVTVQNHDAAINIFIGAANVTSAGANGMVIKPGASSPPVGIWLPRGQALFAVSASGTPVCSVFTAVP